MATLPTVGQRVDRCVLLLSEDLEYGCGDLQPDPEAHPNQVAIIRSAQAWLPYSSNRCIETNLADQTPAFVTHFSRLFVTYLPDRAMSWHVDAPSPLPTGQSRSFRKTPRLHLAPREAPRSFGDHRP